MPGQYKRQEGARKYGYSSEAMSRAVLDVNENHMSVKKAAFLHDVNRTTLMNHLKEFPLWCSRPDNSIYTGRRTPDCPCCAEVG